MQIGPWQELTLAKALSRETVLLKTRQSLLPKISQRSSANSQRCTNSTQKHTDLAHSFNLHTYHRQWQKLESLLSRQAQSKKPRKPPVPRQLPPIDLYTKRLVRLQRVYGLRKVLNSEEKPEKPPVNDEVLVEGCEDAAELLQWVRELPEDASTCSRDDV